jgi:hypothetical protein
VSHSLHDPQHAYWCAVPWCPQYVGNHDLNPDFSAAPHPSDSERTPRLGDDVIVGRRLGRVKGIEGRGERILIEWSDETEQWHRPDDQTSYLRIGEPAIEAESERVSLDVERLADVLHEVIPHWDGHKPQTEDHRTIHLAHAAEIRARLSLSPEVRSGLMAAAAGHLAKYGCNVYHADEPCRWQRSRARLSPSTGKGLLDTGKLPEQPNQDAGGIPYWPVVCASHEVSGCPMCAPEES